MTILRMLRRTTAVAALAALPLAPAAVQAESAQATGTQPPSSEAPAGKATTAESTGQAQAQTNAQTGQDKNQGTVEADAKAKQTQAEPGQSGTQSGEAPEEAQRQPTQGEQATQTQGEPGQGGTQSGQAPDQAEGQSEGQATQGEQATQTQGEPGQGGTQSGQAPDQAEDQSQGQSTQGEQATQGEPGQSGTQSGQAPDQAQGQAQGGQGEIAQDEDLVVATVGEREIRRSDVLSIIAMLPPQLQQQPPEMLIPIALDQLVMRELILQEAKDAGLESDPKVASLAKEATGGGESGKEDAMVQVWLDKELGKVVTDEKVQQTYDTVKQQMGEQAPPMESLRPQIEQELRQQAFLDIGKDLQADAKVTLYGPDGQPLAQ